MLVLFLKSQDSAIACLKILPLKIYINTLKEKPDICSQVSLAEERKLRTMTENYISSNWKAIKEDIS